MIAFQPLFSKAVFPRAATLVVGALLCVRVRTVAAALRVLGLDHEQRFEAYHRVLSRATWSARQAGAVLLRLLVVCFAKAEHGEVLVFGLDETIERRRGSCIKAKGIYRDAVRSSKGHFVKASGLRWLSVMLLSEVSWAGRVWALPFLTVLCPSARYHAEQGRAHKKLTDYARQALLQLRRWLPDRPLVVVADSSYSAIEFLASVRSCVTFVTRLRLDAALYEPAPARRPGQVGRPRKKGERLPTLAERLLDPATQWQRLVVSQWYGQQAYTVEVATGTALWYHSGMPVVPLRWVLVRDPSGRLKTKAFLCTDQTREPFEILSWFVRRWSMEVTFEEARRHLGLETQRQWSDLAIARTTPCLLGLFSVVTLLAERLQEEHGLVPRGSAWYQKRLPTFSDALAVVRLVLWRQQHFWLSGSKTETLEIPKALFERLTGTLAYAA